MDMLPAGLKAFSPVNSDGRWNTPPLVFCVLSPLAFSMECFFRIISTLTVG